MRWRAILNVWPHFGERSSIGGPLKQVEFDAESIEDAVKIAGVFKKGIETNPAVWQAPIVGLAVLRP